MKVSTQIKELQYKAYMLAIDEVERSARKILKEHPNLNEFVMGMGVWFFTTKEGNNISEYGGKVEKSYLKPIANFIDEFAHLQITSESMRFTATGVKVTDW